MKYLLEFDTDTKAARVVTADGASAPAAEPTPADPAYATQYVDKPWPHLIQIAGLQIMAKAPINPAWKPGMTDYIFGQAPSFVWDGANGDTFDPPRPLRSPMGFPQGWVVVDGVEIGTINVYYEGKAFNSDEEVMDYIRRVNARDAALAEGPGWQQVWDAYQQRSSTPVAAPAGGTAVPVEQG